MGQVNRSRSLDTGTKRKAKLGREIFERRFRSIFLKLVTVCLSAKSAIYIHFIISPRINLHSFKDSLMRFCYCELNRVVA